MFRIIRKKFKIILTVLITAGVLSLGIHTLWPMHRGTAVLYPVWSRQTVLMIDAGHGGEDGGAVSPNGTVESQINLAVALRLDQLCGLCGIRAKLLRDADVSLHDSDCETLREKKVSDLHNRAAAVESEAGATLLSIHQNSYPDGRYSGAQVFFAPTEGSAELAACLQEALRQGVSPENQRQAKRIPDTVYLMNHVTCRAVLVECGFLTNGEEERLLCTPSYQTKLAAALCAGYLNDMFSSKESLHGV